MDRRDKVIEELNEVIRQLRQTIAEQAALLKAQAERIAQLELALAKAQKDSTTSSKPPSSDITKPKAKQARPGRAKKRSKGGQPGHNRKLREPLPQERVDETIEYFVADAEIARLGLKPTGNFEAVQHIELPQSPVHVTEYRLMEYQDTEGNLYYPECPELRGPIFGPRLLATIGWLKSVGHLSYSSVEMWMEDVLQVPVSRGYLAKLCTGVVSEALQPAYDELVDTIPRQKQLGSDETSIKDNGKKHWIWCITAATFSVFHIATTRSRGVLEKLVGPEFAGYLNFDYFSANCSFAWNFSIKAQYCWAHLIREIRFLEKHPDEETKVWAQQLLDRTRRLFRAYHRRGEMTDEGYQRSMLTHRDRFLQLVRQHPSSKEAQNLAARFTIVAYTSSGMSETETYDLSQDYFRFMFDSTVEPTNNHSEQQIRHCVIDRKITQGTRSESGQRYHERMWTAVATCKKQNRNFFDFLYTSIQAKISDCPRPTLLAS